MGFVDPILDYYHAVQVDLPTKAGELGATYAIPIIYVPVLPAARARCTVLSRQASEKP